MHDIVWHISVLIGIYIIIKEIRRGSAEITNRIDSLHHMIGVLNDKRMERLPIYPDAPSESLPRIEEELEKLNRTNKAFAKDMLNAFDKALASVLEEITGVNVKLSEAISHLAQTERNTSLLLDIHSPPEDNDI